MITKNNIPSNYQSYENRNVKVEGNEQILTSNDDVDNHEISNVNDNWVLYSSPDGYPYYFNENTKESIWASDYDATNDNKHIDKQYNIADNRISIGNNLVDSINGIHNNDNHINNKKDEFNDKYRENNHENNTFVVNNAGNKNNDNYDNLIDKYNNTNISDDSQETDKNVRHKDRYNFFKNDYTDSNNIDNCDSNNDYNTGTINNEQAKNEIKIYNKNLNAHDIGRNVTQQHMKNNFESNANDSKNLYSANNVNYISDDSQISIDNKKTGKNLMNEPNYNNNKNNDNENFKNIQYTNDNHDIFVRKNPYINTSEVNNTKIKIGDSSGVSEYQNDNNYYNNNISDDSIEQRNIDRKKKLEKNDSYKIRNSLNFNNGNDYNANDQQYYENNNNISDNSDVDDYYNEDRLNNEDISSSSNSDSDSDDSELFHNTRYNLDNDISYNKNKNKSKKRPILDHFGEVAFLAFLETPEGEAAVEVSILIFFIVYMYFLNLFDFSFFSIIFSFICSLFLLNSFILSDEYGNFEFFVIDISPLNMI
jgi:hypothetical protein